MKKVLVLALFVGAAASARAQTSPPAGQARPAATASAGQPMDLAKFKIAVTEARRKLFAAGMSDLTPQQLETFWAVYGDYEKEKDAVTATRLDLVRKYVETYATLTDAQISQLVNEAGSTQKQNVDLRMKYFGIYSQKLNARAAGRFALIDDYITTALRLQILDQLPMPGGQPGK